MNKDSIIEISFLAGSLAAYLAFRKTSLEVPMVLVGGICAKIVTREYFKKKMEKIDYGS